MSVEEPIAAGPAFKRNLMSEFSAIYSKTTEPENMSCTRQISEDVIEVELKQFPDQGETHDVVIFDELNRLRYFGWQLRYIKYDKLETLFMYFQKVDWRSVDYYNLVHNEYNNEKNIWWLKR